jgi:HAD superfamily hydrolase (TIGR01509 family)
MLGYAGLLKFMDVVVTNQDVVDGKPSPEGYKLAMSQLGVASSESLVIEDGEHGVLAAIAAGAQVLRVNGPIDVSIELLLPMIPKLRG